MNVKYDVIIVPGGVLVGDAVQHKDPIDDLPDVSTIRTGYTTSPRIFPRRPHRARFWGLNPR